MENQYIFREARADEIQGVFDLIMRRVAWMDTVGIKQWNTTKYDERYPLHYYESRRQMHELFVLEDAASGKMLAVGALFHDDIRWPDPQNAFYLHHLASDTDAQGFGSIFLEKAEEYTASCGKQYMRLDSAIGNKFLESFYTSRGYVEAGRCQDGLYYGILRQKKLF